MRSCESVGGSLVAGRLGCPAREAGLTSRHRCCCCSNEYLDSLAKLEEVKDGMVGGGQPVELAVELLKWVAPRSLHVLARPASLAPHPPTQPPTCPACRAVDEGTNPDTFTVQLFRDSMAQNQARWGLWATWRETTGFVPAQQSPAGLDLGLSCRLPVLCTARARWRRFACCSSSWRRRCRRRSPHLQQTTSSCGSRQRQHLKRQRLKGLLRRGQQRCQQQRRRKESHEFLHCLNHIECSASELSICHGMNQRTCAYAPNGGLVKATSCPSALTGSLRGPNTRTCTAQPSIVIYIHRGFTDLPQKRLLRAWRMCVSRPFWWLASTAICSKKPFKYVLQPNKTRCGFRD